MKITPRITQALWRKRDRHSLAEVVLNVLMALFLTINCHRTINENNLLNRGFIMLCRSVDAGQPHNHINMRLNSI